jgi:hypothetical protein
LFLRRSSRLLAFLLILLPVLLIPPHLKSFSEFPTRKHAKRRTRKHAKNQRLEPFICVTKSHLCRSCLFLRRSSLRLPFLLLLLPPLLLPPLLKLWAYMIPDKPAGRTPLRFASSHSRCVSGSEGEKASLGILVMILWVTGR